MDEHEWDHGADPFVLLDAIPNRSDRKARLFSIACCRRVSVAPNIAAELQPVLDVAERYADAWTNDGEFDAAHNRAGVVYGREQDATFWYADAVLETTMVVLDPSRVVDALFEMYRGPAQAQEPEFLSAADLLRDVFNNPFRPVTFDPSWRTEAVVALARGMYEARDFAAMPVLADALDDAGCDHPDILAHCRGAGPHVRGCWVVDLVLGKA